jgi:hypothetical protein
MDNSAWRGIRSVPVRGEYRTSGAIHKLNVDEYFICHHRQTNSNAKNAERHLVLRKNSRRTAIKNT